MDLDLDLDQFEISPPLEPELVRELVPADLDLLEARPTKIKSSHLKRISERHHALARNLASGMGTGEAAHMVGLSITHVSILKNDPAFKELIEFYREKVDAKYAAVHEQLAGMSLDATLIIRERMEQDPDKIPISVLSQLVQLGADRTGNGPSSKTTVDVNINLANRLEQARKRVAERKLIDITPNEDAA